MSDLSGAVQLAGMVNDSITDGPGLRLTLFLQGCPRHCPGCHNESALDASGGAEEQLFALYEKVKKNPLLSGVTFSGGEPLLQAKALLPLAQRLRAEGYHLALYTGYTLEELLLEGDRAKLSLLSEMDTVVDGPFLLEERDLGLPFRGSGNQRILKGRESVLSGAPVFEDDPAWQGKHAT